MDLQRLPLLLLLLPVAGLVGAASNGGSAPAVISGDTPLVVARDDLADGAFALALADLRRDFYSVRTPAFSISNAETHG
eukprot:SAG31_NODE_18209_length_643_cov_1.413603_1_plen_79_part_00